MSDANSRLETFSDGVFAIAMTLLIIDVKLPSAASLGSTAEVWRALARLGPAVFAFLLSFIIILITWVNHHGAMKLVRKSSAAFIYANGCLLLTVVFIPFPTSLMGDLLGSPHAAPAVVLYNAVIAVQSLAWVFVTTTAITGGLVNDAPQALNTIRKSLRNGYVAVAFYSLLAIGAVWYPNGIAVITTLSWVFWLVLGLRLRHE